MNWKFLLLSLFVAPVWAAQVSLDISIKTESSAISKTVFLSEKGNAEFTQDDIAVSVRTSEAIKDEGITADLVVEMDVYEKGQLISKPVLVVAWEKKASISLGEIDEYEKEKVTFAIEVIASQME